MKFQKKYFMIVSIIGFGFACSKPKPIVITPVPPAVVVVPPVAVKSDIEFWLTSGNKFALLQKQNAILNFSSTANSDAVIEIDTIQTYQTIDGFGYTLTGGSALLINKLETKVKADLLQELFGNNENSIGVNYLRVSIGASDLHTSAFSYCDQLDETLKSFSIENDVEVINLLKEIIAINPKIKIMASPWSAPPWMKDNGNFKGGSLKTQYYGLYAAYFIKYIQAMKAKGITIDAITIQNEPENPNNNPSMVMRASEQSVFIKEHLGPAFKAANFSTKIIIFDHNCDNPKYPISILDDPAAKPFIDGSAFHLYAGDINALNVVRNAHPDKNIYFTEQWTAANGDFGGDFGWHMKNVIIGSSRNWSKIALEWNLANDATNSLHTPGGCVDCKGALTIQNGVTRNVSYYIIAQIAKFVPAGSVRIKSSLPSKVNNVAFKRPDGKKVLIVYNEDAAAARFNLVFNSKTVSISIPANSAGSFIW